MRTDPFCFYGLSLVSFLESTVATYVENLSPYFDGDPEIQRWLVTVWLPEEAEHGRLARQYVEKTWPEFDWEDGYDLFLNHYRPRCNYSLLRPSPALEALARCVTETEATMMYRCIGSYASDPELRILMKKLSTDEVRHYTYFRDVFDKYDSAEKNSFLRKAQTIIARSELVRDEDIALAFMPLNHCWRGRMPFEKINYSGFLVRTSTIIEQHFPFEAAKRMLFRPLGKSSRLEALAVDFITWMLRRQYPKKVRTTLSRKSLGFRRLPGTGRRSARLSRPHSNEPHVHHDFHKSIMRILLVAVLLAAPTLAFADENKLVKLDTRPGVSVAVYYMKRDGATATVVLLSGRGGGIGLKNEVPTSTNFLVRTRDLFAVNGFNVAVVNRPTDHELDYEFRVSPQHIHDLRQVVGYVKKDTGLPVWLIGTSRGTTSAAAAGIAFGNEELAGLVLTSSITTAKKMGAVPSLELEAIRIPVLVLHHEKDSCEATVPRDVPRIINKLKNAPVKKLVMVNGGAGASGDPCEPLHWHGFIGMDKEAVDIIADWIKNPKG